MSPIEWIVLGSYFLAIYLLVYWFLLFFDKWDVIKEEYSEKLNLTRYPLVSILVPAYNEEKTIQRTLQSLIELDWPKDKLEIIVINDGSKDKTSQIVKEFISSNSSNDIKLIEQPNAGKGAALNKGLSILKGELFACLDADSFVESQTLKYMAHWHLKYSNIAITTPIMKIDKPKSALQKLQRIEYILGMFLTKLMNYIDTNYIAPGPFSTYKTQIIKDLGGFDEHNLVEDQEIAYRAQQHQYKIMQVPYAVVHTKGPEKFKAFRAQRNRWYKGTLINIFKYKHLMFKKAYGDFGFFQLPIVNILAYVLSIIALIGFANYTLVPILKQIHQSSLIGFDLIPFFKTFHLEFNILSTNILFTFILVFSFILMLTFLYLSSKINKDDLRPHWIYLIPFFLIYFIIVAYIMVLVMLELIVGKKQKW